MKIKVTTICRVDIRLTILDSRAKVPTYIWHQSIQAARDDAMQRLASAGEAEIPMILLCQMLWTEKGEAKFFEFFYGKCGVEA